MARSTITAPADLRRDRVVATAAREVRFRRLKGYERICKWRRRGGEVRFIDVNDPMRNLIHPNWPKSFVGGLDRKQAVRQFVEYMATVREAEPKVEFFVIVNFPLWASKETPSYVGPGPLRFGDGGHDRLGSYADGL